MDDLRRGLDREGERFDLAPGALDRLFERRRRKYRNQRIGAGLVAFVVLAVGTWAAVSLVGGRGSGPQPASSPTPSSDRRHFPGIAGTYSVTLSNREPGVAANSMAGTYSMRLFADGVVQLTAPTGSLQEGPSPSGISFRLDGDRFTTNAFVNISCPGSIGTYRWELADGRLVFTPVKDDCAIRRTLFATGPWLVGVNGASP